MSLKPYISSDITTLGTDLSKFSIFTDWNLESNVSKILAKFAFDIRTFYFGEMDPDINSYFIQSKRWLHSQSILMEMITGMYFIISESELQFLITI